MHKDQESLREILSSWERCMERGMLSKDTIPAVNLKNDELESRLRENEKIISAFERSMETLKDLLVSKSCVFLLASRDGILLRKSSRRASKSFEEWRMTTGMSFLEESSGTNAIAMAMRLKKPICLLPQYNFCSFLKGWYCHAIPIWCNKKPAGYLAVCDMEDMLMKELIAVVELLGYRIENELAVMAAKEVHHTKHVIKLNDKQLSILKLFARGLTERAISLEMGLSLGTVRYHKLNIFKKLGAGCTVEAAIKALKLGVMLLDEVEG